MTVEEPEERPPQPQARPAQPQVQPAERPEEEAATPRADEASEGQPALETLLELQDLDTAISQLQHRRSALSERQELASVRAALTDVGRRAAEIEGSRGELLKRQQALEADIGSATARREMLEQRMYAARGAPARDLQAMDEEIRHLRQRREQLEDAELEVMVALEPLDAELASLEAEGVDLRARGEHLRGVLDRVEGEIDEELAAQVSARAVAALSIPEDLRDRYESLRARLGGTGAARLVGSRCSGCHLELPSMEVDRIRHLSAGTVVTCEQCGRILVPATSPRTP